VNNGFASVTSFNFDRVDDLMADRILDEQVTTIYRLIPPGTIWQVISSVLNSKALLLIRGRDPGHGIVMI
jgi:hypothetical protein